MTNTGKWEAVGGQRKKGEGGLSRVRGYSKYMGKAKNEEQKAQWGVRRRRTRKKKGRSSYRPNHTSKKCRFRLPPVFASIEIKWLGVAPSLAEAKHTASADSLHNF